MEAAYISLYLKHKEVTAAIDNITKTAVYIYNKRFNRKTVQIFTVQ